MNFPKAAMPNNTPDRSSSVTSSGGERGNTENGEFEKARQEECEKIIRNIFEKALFGNSIRLVQETGARLNGSAKQIDSLFLSYVESKELFLSQESWLTGVILSAYRSLTVPAEINGENFFSIVHSDFLYYFEKFCIDVLEPNSGIIAATFKNKDVLRKKFILDVTKHEGHVKSECGSDTIPSKKLELRLREFLLKLFETLFYIQYSIGELLAKTPYLSPSTPNELSDIIKKRTERAFENKSADTVISISVFDAFPRPRELRDFLTHFYKEHSVNDREMKNFLEWIGIVEVVFEGLIDFHERILFFKSLPTRQIIDEKTDPEMFASLQMTLLSLSHLLGSSDVYIGKKSAYFKNLLAKGLGVRAISLNKIDTLKSMPVEEFLAYFSGNHTAAGFDLLMQFSSRFWKDGFWRSVVLSEHLSKNPKDIVLAKKILRLPCAEHLNDDIIIELLVAEISWSMLEKIRDVASAELLLFKHRELELSKKEAMQLKPIPSTTYIFSTKTRIENLVPRKKIKTHGAPNEVKRLTDLFGACRFPLSKERTEKFEHTPKGLIDYAFTCAKRSGARDVYISSFESALLHALEEKSQEPLQRYMAEFEQSKLLRLLPAHALDKAVWLSLQQKDFAQQRILALQTGARVETILRSIDPGKLSSTLQNKSGRGTGSTAARIESLIKAVRQQTEEVDEDFLMRICTFNWETHVQHLPVQIEDVRDGKTKYMMEHLPKGTVGFHACIVSLLENLEDLKNRDAVDLSMLASVLKGVVRSWDKH